MIFIRLTRCAIAVGSLLSTSAPVSAEVAQVDYLRDIKPVLKSRCYACHGALMQKAGLRLDTAKAIVEGGDSGPAVVRGRSRESLLIRAVAGAPGVRRMPFEGESLSDEQIDALRRWIDEGAPVPESETPATDPTTHWAFDPPTATRPPYPSQAPSSDRFTVHNPIDAFVADAHRKSGLTPAPPANRYTLLRRLYLDLVGLPPSSRDLQRFLADDSHESYEDIVDRLLASPEYGERWARHWMDVWRYADWSGEVNNQVRGSPRHIWRWRDWIVESINEDKGYDRMILEMLAADEIAPSNADALRATGFLARNWYKFNRNVWLDDTVEHTAKAFLGLTYGCAKCHDHKYDPISQQNYYELRAFFEPHDVRTDPIAGNADTDGLVRVFDADPGAPTYVLHRGDEKQPDLAHPLSPNLPDVFESSLRIEKVPVPPSDEYPATSTGRRSALAKWMIDPRNPLTARVAVNHIWLRHFGAPLVDAMTDFGLRTPKPRYAKLLDWLAVDFMEGGWRMKRLHRLIVTSTTYRMSSGGFEPHPDNLARDPDNRFLWRMNARRLEAEAIRDSILHCAGRLDRTMGGKEIPLTDGGTSLRRSLYFRHGHERQFQFLEIFDGASVLECYRRTTSIIPQQALALSNSNIARSHSRLLAGRLSAVCGSGTKADERFVRLAFEQILSRPPNDAESNRCREFLTRQARPVSDAANLTDVADRAERKTSSTYDRRARARASLVHVLFNHNDFVTLR